MIENVSADGVVVGDIVVENTIPDNYVGGLVGSKKGEHSTLKIDRASAWCRTGGLVGNNFGQISYSTSSCEVSGGIGKDIAPPGGYRGSGGLVGNNYGAIENSFSVGPVAAIMGRIGGLAGFNERGTVVNSYSSGSVLGVDGFNIGGLVGENDGTLTHTLATGSVAAKGTGVNAVGGLVGKTGDHGTVVASYWDVNTTGQLTSAAGSGLTTQELKFLSPRPVEYFLARLSISIVGTAVTGWAHSRDVTHFPGPGRPLPMSPQIY